MRVRRLYRTIVEYGFAMTATAGACGGAPAAPMRPREGVTPGPCDGPTPERDCRARPTPNIVEGPQVHPCERDACSITGRVHEPDASGVSGALLVVRWPGLAAVDSGGGAPAGVSVRTGESGQFSLELSGYRGGIIELEVRAPDGRQAFRQAHAEDGGTVTVDIELPAKPHEH